MSTALKLNISEQQYLAGERQSQSKHEYINGNVLAMAGGTIDHNTICGNIFAQWQAQLKGQACSLFIADVHCRRIGLQPTMSQAIQSLHT